MATQVQFRRGNTAQTNAFTGAVAEITVDTDKETVVVHDGSTAGGFPLARESALSANLAFTQAAFNLANTANIKIDSGYDFANTVNIKTDAAFTKANAANVLAQAAFDKANTANVTAEAGFAKANTANTTAESAFSKANSANVLAQAAFDKANTGLANTGTSVTANGLTQYTFANTTVSTSNTTGALTVAGGVGIKGSIYADAIYDGGVEVISFANQAFNLANTANIKIDSGYAFANIVNIKVDAAFSFSNTVNIKTDAAFTKANAANVLAQAAFNQANTANVTAEAGFAKANSANVLAQAAFNKANNALANTGGSISGDLTITGNLTIIGQQVYANTQTVLIKDNIITLNAAIDQAAAPSANAGLEIDRGSSANVYLLWNENSDVWQFTNDGTTYYTIADTSTLSSAFNLANTANITAEASFARANAANILAQAAFNQANTANIKIDSGYAFANTVNIKVDSAFAFSNTVNIKVDSAFAFSNTVNIKTDAAFAFANIANIKVDSAFAFSNTVNIKTDAAFVKANAANVLAQAAFDKANSVTQQGFVTVAANGINVVADANNDTLTLSAANGIGITSNATTDTITINLTPTGVTSGTYGSASIVPVFVVDAQGRLSSVTNTVISFPVTSVAGVTGAVSNTQLINGIIAVDGTGSGLDADLLDGLQGSSYANTTFTQAAFDKANVANVTAEAGFSKANSANVLAQAAFDKANTDTTNISVTPGIYGNSSAIPSITVAANGRISAITTESFTAASIADVLALSIALG